MEDAKAELARIGRLRRKLGLTQKKLASLSSVSQSLIAKIESGSIDPAYSKVRQILSALESESKRSEVRKRAQDIMTRHIVSVSPSENLGRVIHLMKRENVSQLPVFSGSLCVGSLSDSMFVDWIEKYGDKLTKVTAGEVMEESFPSIPPGSDLEAITSMLKYYRAVLVKEKGKITGIITKADLINAIRP